MTARRWILVVLAAVAFFLVWFLVDVPPLSVLRQWADSTGAWFPVLFWLLYVLIIQFPVPRTVMTLSSGILFGSLWGSVIAITAATVAAVISLLVVRYLLRDIVEPHLSTYPGVDAINQRLEERGWLAIASLRLIAVVPFSILNYVAALTRVRVPPFAVATLIGSIPNTLVGTIFGDALTGHARYGVVAVVIVLSIVGVAGLLIDARVPTNKK